MIPSSIFNLSRSKDDLQSSNQGMSSLYYDEIASLRNIMDGAAVGGNNFGNGLITYRFHPASGTWWLPSRSYLRIDCTLSKSDGTMLDSLDNIAPNMGLASCLFQKIQFDMNDKTISEISEHVPQVDALKTRLRQTGQWMRTTGQSVNFWHSDFFKRQQECVLAGLDMNSIVYHDDILQAPDAGSGVPPTFLDHVTPNTIQFLAGGAGAGGILLIPNGGADIPDLSEFLSIGSIIYYNDGAEKTSSVAGFATTTTTNDTIIPTSAVTAQNAANLANQLRISQKHIRQSSSSSRKVKSFSIIYRPPISIFDVGHAIPGSAKFELKMTPFSNNVYQKNAIESILADKTNTLDGVARANEFRFKVDDMLFYAARCEGPRVEQDEYFLDLQECRVQLAQITTQSRTQFSLNVSPSTCAISAAFQDNAAGSDTRYSLTRFKIRNEEELNLENFYIRYGGIQRPQPDYRPLYDEETNTDRMVEQYIRSNLYTGAYFDSSSESLAEWRARGFYVHFPWPKTGSDRESRVYISTQFSALTSQPHLLLFNHYKKVCILKIQNGQLTEVLVNEV